MNDKYPFITTGLLKVITSIKTGVVGNERWGWYENKNGTLSEELTSKRITCIAEGKSDT